MLKLERNPDIDLDYVMSTEVSQGILKHLDVLVIPSSVPATVKKYLTGKVLTGFMDNGGTVITTGKADGMVPEHKNYKKLSCKDDVVKCILK